MLKSKVMDYEKGVRLTKALMIAVENRNLHLARQLINAGAELDVIDRLGSSALMYAAKNGDIAMVSMLLDEGADTTLANGCNETALVLAVEGKHESVAAVLIDYEQTRKEA